MLIERAKIKVFWRPEGRSDIEKALNVCLPVKSIEGNKRGGWLKAKKGDYHLTRKGEWDGSSIYNDIFFTPSLMNKAVHKYRDYFVFPDEVLGDIKTVHIAHCGKHVSLLLSEEEIDADREWHLLFCGLDWGRKAVKIIDPMVEYIGHIHSLCGHIANIYIVKGKTQFRNSVILMREWERDCLIYAGGGRYIVKNKKEIMKDDISNPHDFCSAMRSLGCL